MTTSPHARLIYSASEIDANMLWGTQFFAPDPFTYIEKRGKRFLVRSDLEMDQARDQVRVDKVPSYSVYVRRHKAPGINSRNHTILKTGHVVTVEPGLYHPGKGGVPLEDIVLVAKTGCKNLVGIPKILEV